MVPLARVELASFQLRCIRLEGGAGTAANNQNDTLSLELRGRNAQKEIGNHNHGMIEHFYSVSHSLELDI